MLDLAERTGIRALIVKLRATADGDDPLSLAADKLEALVDAEDVSDGS